MHHHHSFIGIDGARLYMRTLRQEVMYLLKEAWKLHDDWFIAPPDMRDDSPMMLVSYMLIVADEDIDGDGDGDHGGCGSDDDRVERNRVKSNSSSHKDNTMKHCSQQR